MVFRPRWPAAQRTLELVCAGDWYAEHCHGIPVAELPGVHVYARLRVLVTTA
jgi:hypothetical protein